MVLTSISAIYTRKKMMSEEEYWATTRDVVMEMIEEMPLDDLQILVRNIQQVMLHKLVEGEDR